MAVTSRVIRTRARSLSAKTTPSDPDRFYQPIMLPARTGGVRVNEDTAMTLGAVWACVRVISETLAGLPWKVYRDLGMDGVELQENHPNNWLLDRQPNPETPAFQFRETMLAHALTWGNGYAEIEKTMSGTPAWLWQITPDRVQVERFRGRIIYDVSNHNEPNSVLEADEMFHLRGLGFDGLVGYSVIRMFARTIGLGIALEDSSSTFFANDSTPGGVLEAPNRLSDAARQNLERSWKARHQGPANRRNIAILEEGLKYNQTGLPPEDSQIVQQRQMTPAEVCRIFRVPPHKIADLTRSTNNNIEHQEIEFVSDTLRPWSERLESEADIKLFGRNNRGTLVTILDMDELKRGDMAARAQFNSAMLDRGVWSVNEVRRRENQNPIGPDGDKRFVPLNMQLLEKAGEEPPPEPEAAPAEPDAIEPATEQSDDRLAQIERGCIAVLEDACRRNLKREKDAKKLDGAALGQWIGKHREYCRETLSAGVQMLAALHSEEPDLSAAAALGAYLEGYMVDPASERNYAKETEKLRTLVVAACAATKAKEKE